MKDYEIIRVSTNSLVAVIRATSYAEVCIIAQNKGYGSGFRVEEA